MPTGLFSRRMSPLEGARRNPADVRTDRHKNKMTHAKYGFGSCRHYVTARNVWKVRSSARRSPRATGKARHSFHPVVRNRRCWQYLVRIQRSRACSSCVRAPVRWLRYKLLGSWYWRRHWNRSGVAIEEAHIAHRPVTIRQDGLLSASWLQDGRRYTVERARLLDPLHVTDRGLRRRQRAQRWWAGRRAVLLPARGLPVLRRSGRRRLRGAWEGEWRR